MAILRFFLKRLGMEGLAVRLGNVLKRGWVRFKAWLFDKK